MLCPSCDSSDFGVSTNEDGDIIRYCSDCGYEEEASPSEVAEYVEANVLTQEPAPQPEDVSPQPSENWFATTPANPAEFLPQPPIQGVEAHLVIQDEVPAENYASLSGQVQSISFVTHDTPEGTSPEDATELLSPEELEHRRQIHAALKLKMMQEREQRRQQLPCKFYCPSTEEEAEAPTNWPWDRKLPFGACSNPNVVGTSGIGACQYPTARGACPARRDPDPVPETTPYITQLVNG